MTKVPETYADALRLCDDHRKRIADSGGGWRDVWQSQDGLWNLWVDRNDTGEEYRARLGRVDTIGGTV